jgi:hypothetical protein
MLEKVGIEVPKLNLATVEVLLIGDSPLIVHAWSNKAKEMMLAKQMKKAKQAKEAKDPERDYQESLYPVIDGSHTFPAVGFKAAMVSACRFVENMKMTSARGAFHILGEYIKIQGEPSRREDMVRVGMGTADIRYRAEFKTWKALLTISYNQSAISAEQIINLLNVAGFGVGVGEWRPERDGSYGRFHVATEKEAA